MDELQSRHRKEAKDLQNKITSKKKQATKKTRKGVNDECDRLEQEMRDRHAAELASLNGDPAPSDAPIDSLSTHSHDTTDLTNGASALSLDDRSPTSSHPASTSTPSLASTSTTAADATQPRKPNRARARMQRRAAEQERLMANASAEASLLPDLKQAERDRMIENFRTRGLVEKEIRADGHCLYSAVADQMEFQGLAIGDTRGGEAKVGLFKTISNGLRREKDVGEATERYRVVRRAAGEYMLGHEEEFAPFLDEGFEGYVQKVQETAEWGGQLELIALARRYGVQINVLQGDGRVEEIVPEGKEKGEAKVLWLAYYRHGFGLGEHYNSLRKVG
ncbi:cysteine proteinase [Myriangium duriaei CBS 260.36]|uniref:Cysteine proteinase n=1 Tax=Myriangium duriaei CBS 260.36 TaxID=1168546 RepID=A0A9P4MNN2_9PEZI|nr:cysteine proteinase [Myriangium duriaei CBS 260.36]